MRFGKKLQRRRGAALIAVLIIAVLLGAFCLVSLMMTTSESRSSSMDLRYAAALFTAQSGAEDEINRLSAIQGAASLSNPFANIDTLAGKTMLTNVVLTKDNAAIGQYTVVISKVTAVSNTVRDLTIVSTGWVPNSTTANAARRTVTSVVRMSLGKAQVFDYVYFINNWGWYYGNTITANGNVRSNGQFDGGGYSPTINPLPRYGTVQNGTLSNQTDAGGLYSGWNVANSGNVKGITGNWTQTDVNNGLCDASDVGTPKYTHPYVDQIKMPNLTDLGVYETMAKANNSNIKVNNVQVCGPVLGDDTNEKHNLYLIGTKDKPIQLNGPIVVRGNVMISGYVSGKGAIYASGNVYIPDSIQYVNDIPALPSSKDTASLQTWMTTANTKDALGLFARQHIVIGDYTDSAWQSNVSQWVNDSRNSSKEDAGSDGIPNTKAGRDGILGTADDDVLENDGVWTVDHYTQDQANQGLIPTGSKVGDVIPGSGEDIDGNGVYNGTTQMSEFAIPTSDYTINSGSWAGNPPANGAKYDALAKSDIATLDCALYTNHTVAMYNTNGNFVLTGCVVSRNEAMIYHDKLTLNFDMRLLDASGTFGLALPMTWQPLQVLVWSCDGPSSLK